MSQPVLKADVNWGQPSSVASAREAILTELNQATGVGPGDYLRQLREVAKLDIREASSQLGINPTIVVAMENDDYGNLPAPIYVKGFYRRYCDLLSISADAVIKAYEDSTTSGIPELNRVTINQQMNQTQQIIRYSGYVLAGLFALLLLYAAQSLDYSGLWDKVSGSSGEQSSNSATDLSLPFLEESLSGPEGADKKSH